ncbi:DUF1049 domain-containing protein [Calidifontimicrobium sp. SYSU G02091]|uniref:DUF1049 domain-containing protein n=1 Tax=Calidifontimicrobium sp. SYSU G02091 TaxID=2926421 RepID=UPI001F534DAF|nr:DUF1049 domain-containing protein [Calidifontimicrobium sp. SYSU G02091]MCI1190981.1 DUF1049 domain-containing protein [Calidifontimicrobium sp. SYSU G02091]
MRYVYLAIVVLALAALVTFKLQNLQSVTITFLTASLTLPASVLVAVVYVLGMLTGGSLLALLRGAVRKASQQAPADADAAPKP